MRTPCSYYLGQLLFQELLEGLSEDEIGAKLRDLYALTLAQQEAGLTPGIDPVRQVFSDQPETVEKHWSGDLNAPENRPFDEGVGRRSLNLVRWDDYPTYARGWVSFRGTLLEGAVLGQTKREVHEGGY